MRKRRAYITFPEQFGSDSALLANQKKIEGVNIRFKVQTYNTAGSPASAYITVYNLNRKDLQFLSTGAATWLQKQNLMQLYAGYDNDVSLIAGGQIMEAIPQGNPDVALSIKLINGVQWLGHNLEIQKSDFNLAALIDETAEKMGWTVNCPQWLRDSSEILNKKISDFSYTGSPMDLIAQIQEMCGGFGLTEKSVNISMGMNSINIWSPVQQPGNPQILEINKRTGMIGYPQPTTGGVSVQILLNPNIQTGQLVHITSERTPFINGEYYVVSITHEGELRGNNWYSTLECSRTTTGTKGATNADE